MIFQKPLIGLALSGGGAKGLAYIGVLEVLKKENIPVNIIAGTSMGAIVGAVYCLNPDIEIIRQEAYRAIKSDAYKDIGLENFRKTDEDTWFDRLRNKLKGGMVMTESFLKQSFVPEENITKIFKTIFGENTFDDLKIPFAAVSLDLISGRDIIMKEGYLWEAVKASAAIPGIFPPVRMGDMVLVDGGVTANIPIEAAIDMGAEIVIAIVFDEKPSHPGNLNTAFEIYMRSDELAKVKLEKMLLSKADIVIPVDTMGHHWTEFENIDFFIERGRISAQKNIKDIKNIITKKTSFLKRILKI